MTLIDLFRQFGSTATDKNYPGSARVLYYTLMYVWNEQRRPPTITISSILLQTLTGLPETTYRRALAFLADRGWLKRYRSRNGARMVIELRVAGVPVAASQTISNTPAQRTETTSSEEERNAVAFLSSTQPEVIANVQPVEGDVKFTQTGTRVSETATTMGTASGSSQNFIPDLL